MSVPLHGVARAVLTNTLAQVGGRAVTVVLGLLTVVLSTRYLGADGYGELATVIALATMVVTIADVGISTVLPRELAKHEAQTDEVASALFVFRVLTSGAFVLVAATLTPILPYSDNVRAGLLIALIGAFFLSVGRFPSAFFQVHLKMHYSAVLDIVYRAVAILLVAAAVVADLGFYAVVAASTIAAICWAAGSFALSARFWKAHMRVAWRESRSLLRDSVALWGITVVGLLHFKGDMLILAAFRPSEDVGIYAVGYAFLEQALFLPGFVMAAIFPIVMHRISGGEHTEARVVIRKGFEILVLGGIATALVFLFMANTLVHLVASSEFEDAVVPMRIVSLALVPLFANALLFALLVAVNRTRALLLVSGATIGINTALNLALIPKYGYVAAALTTVLTETLGFAMNLFFARRAYPALDFGFVPRAALATAGAAMAGLAGLAVSEPAAAALAVATFISLVLVAGLVSVDDVRLTLKRPSVDTRV